LTQRKHLHAPVDVAAERAHDAGRAACLTQRMEGANSPHESPATA
jgi:hypothetical protein